MRIHEMIKERRSVGALTGRDVSEEDAKLPAEAAFGDHPHVEVLAVR